VWRLAQLQENDKAVLIYSTFPSTAEAERVGGSASGAGLAACVNIFPQMTAIYIWQGKRQRESEAAMLIKTRAELADRVVAEARKIHPYTNPGPDRVAHHRRLAGLSAVDCRTNGQPALESLSWSGLSRPSIHRRSAERVDGWILGTPGTSPSAKQARG
jgi:periplasmic divalent cation tolerance protein